MAFLSKCKSMPNEMVIKINLNSNLQYSSKRRRFLFAVTYHSTNPLSTCRMEMATKPISTNNVKHKISQFLWFLKNLDDFSKPIEEFFARLEFAKKGFNVSAVIFEDQTFQSL